MLSPQSPTHKTQVQTGRRRTRLVLRMHLLVGSGCKCTVHNSKIIVIYNLFIYIFIYCSVRGAYVKQFVQLMTFLNSAKERIVQYKYGLTLVQLTCIHKLSFPLEISYVSRLPPSLNIYTLAMLHVVRHKQYSTSQVRFHPRSIISS
jgi:hypothetical protein